MSPRRYAEKTSVPISRSRDQISMILRNWGAESVHWSDEFHNPISHTLRFIWRYKDKRFTARFTLQMDMDRITKEAIDNRTGKVSENKLQKRMTNWSQEAHRTLLVMLKGIFNAVDLGIIQPEFIFIAFTEDHAGNMLGDILAERLIGQTNINATKLIANVSITNS